MRSPFRPFTLLTATFLTFMRLVPAQADDAKGLQAQLNAAAAQLSSFSMQMHVNAATAVSGTVTFVRPARFRVEMSTGAMRMAAYFVDGMVYVRIPSGTWRKMSADSALSSPEGLDVMGSIKSAQLTPLPDRIVNGRPFGAFSTVFTLPAAAAAMLDSPTQTFACTYDKATFLVDQCANDMLTLTYSGYNDPANMVELPPEAKSAVLMIVRTPAPAETPPAAPSAAAAPAAAATPSPVPATTP